MNKTANFQLTQWEKTDRIMMEDFNRDNAAIDAALQPPEPLPVQLTIPDMSGFITEYFGAEQEKSRKLMDELARTLSFELKNGIYKLSVN